MIWRMGTRRVNAISSRRRVWSFTSQGWSRGVQAAIAAVTFLLSGWLTIASVSYFGSQDLLSEARERIRTLQQANAELSAETKVLTSAFLEQMDQLEAQSEQQQTALVELTRSRAALRDRLDSRERQLAGIAGQRDRARVLVDDMQHAIAGAEDVLGAVAEESSLLRRRLRAAENQLIELSGQRAASRRVEVGLRWQLAHLEDEMERLRSHRESAQTWLKDWVLGNVEALEDLFVETGVDLEQLVARAVDAPASGQGGPLQVASPDEVMPLASSSDGDPISGNIQRLAALQRIARSLPLASPLDQFHVTSSYGKRRDPFTKAWAYHAGLDLGGSRKAEVLATAPGQVVFAGRSGPYGNMVEVDHGMGIVTRYAHLDVIAVAVGEEVEFRQALGIIGNTGRSTSRHLHYEIRIDGKAFDPANFLSAGRLLVGVFR
jgi:murein DD-endopeptidase MepM/ murein hydrolase activator NlpD